MTYSPFLGYWTKSIAALKREKTERLNRQWEIAHTYYPEVPISILLVVGFGLAANSLFV